MAIRRLIITACENGYFLRAETEHFDEERGVAVNEAPTLTIAAPDGWDDRAAVEALLMAVAEWDGCQENKYATDNLRIAWDRKGHKVDE